MYTRCVFYTKVEAAGVFVRNMLIYLWIASCAMREGLHGIRPVIRYKTPATTTTTLIVDDELATDADRKT